MLDVDELTGILARYSENSSAFLAMNRQTQHFTVPGVEGFIAYRPAGRRCLVQFGDVFTSAEKRKQLLGAFRTFASKSGRRVVGVQLTSSSAELYAHNGFTVNQLGANYARSLEGFSLSGKKFVQLRNKVSRAKRAGISVVEADTAEGLDDRHRELEGIDRKWLHGKGRHVKELAFMVGEMGGRGGDLRRLFLAVDGADRVVAYVSFAPVYGKRAGWLHDLSRRDPDAPPGVLELIVATAIDQFCAEAVSHLHFGFTPFTALDSSHEVTGHSALIARIVRLLGEHGEAMYPAANQVAYKEKWDLPLVEPEYIAFEGGVTFGAVWNLLRLTNSI